MTVYNKLVRDKIPQIIRDSGETPYTRVLDDGEFALHLAQKLEEEVAEYRRDRNMEELADILEVLYALAELHGGRDALEKVYAAKHEKRGGFDERIYLIGKDG